VLWFGPQIVSLFGGVFKRHWIWVLTLAIGAVSLWLVLRRRRPRVVQTTNEI